MRTETVTGIKLQRTKWQIQVKQEGVWQRELSLPTFQLLWTQEKKKKVSHESLFSCFPTSFFRLFSLFSLLPLTSCQRHGFNFLSSLFLSLFLKSSQVHSLVLVFSCSFSRKKSCLWFRTKCLLFRRNTRQSLRKWSSFRVTLDVFHPWLKRMQKKKFFSSSTNILVLQSYLHQEKKALSTEKKMRWCCCCQFKLPFHQSLTLSQTCCLSQYFFPKMLFRIYIPSFLPSHLKCMLQGSKCKHRLWNSFNCIQDFCQESPLTA